MIITVYVLVANLVMPAFYNYWAILGVDIFAIVFWLISFALLGSETSTLFAVVECYDGYCYKKRDVGLVKRYTDFHTYRNALAAAAGLGGLEL